jgi:hypothetical protein
MVQQRSCAMGAALPSPRKRPVCPALPAALSHCVQIAHAFIASSDLAQRASPPSSTSPASEFVPQVSPSSIASPPRQASAASASSRPASFSTSLGPQDSPQRRSSTRISKPIAEPNLRNTKFGPKTADGRRVILGRPNDDDNGQPERCAWCHVAQDDDWVGRRLCVEGDNPEAVPDGMACKPCKKLYE